MRCRSTRARRCRRRGFASARPRSRRAVSAARISRRSGSILAEALLAPDFAERAAQLSERVQVIVERYPLYEGLTTGTPALGVAAS